ncbi:hypothetical protein Asp14428_34240 [Actinoplanes sp. NBRC 14428]|nr:hypothetical protein Asp14428_34240 [Actinoplanes sp. NBRC 14428]
MPVLALITLWTLDVQTSFADAAALRDGYNTRDNVALPADLMVAALQVERSGSVQMLAAGDREAAALSAQRKATDAAVASFRDLSRRYRGSGISADITRARIAEMNTTFDSLDLIRAQIDARSVTGDQVVTGFTGIINVAFSVTTSTASAGDPLVERVLRTAVALRRAGELLHQEDALLTGATTAGRFTPGEYKLLTEVVGALRFQLPTASSTLPAPDQAAFRSMLGSPTFTALRAAEDQVIAAGGAAETVPITQDVWKAMFNPAVRQFYGFLANGYDKALEFSRAERDRIVIRFGITGVLGLIAILTSLFLSIRIGGSVVRRLSVLQTAATDLAHRRLPETVQRLRAGERIDVAAHTLRLSLGNDEIARVGAALGEVQRSAIESAAGEAAMRYDMNKVLVNIARRNQSLIDRQLEALARTPGADAAGERPAARAEQLAVQMRRHAEHLVILAGSARSRRGLGPEPLARIIARTANEVEHAERIEFGPLAEVEVPEPAVTDIGHLLAELLENGTTFSPPDTPVRISAHQVAEGVVVEIEDHGLGMSASALEETNRRLTQPQEFDPATSARLGLFVVAILAAQRGIRVVLRPSDGQGITATVTIPAELAVPLTTPVAPVTGASLRPVPVTRRSDAARLVGMAGRAGRGSADRTAAPRHAAEDRNV